VKFIISFLLRRIPRKYLQIFSHGILRIVSIFYIGNRVECPICGSKFRKFLPYGRLKSRSNVLCPKCLSLERHRLIWLYLKEKTDFFSTNGRMLHIAPELCFINRFEALDNLDYITADIESPLAKLKMDIHKIPMEDNSINVIFCNHVLEHVDDDLKAMREIYRVLKKGGYAVLQIPLYLPLPDQTIEDPGIKNPKKREELFGQDDHVRKYGKDYPDRLRSVGFKVKSNYVGELTKADIEKYALDATEILFVVNK